MSALNVPLHHPITGELIPPARTMLTRQFDVMWDTALPSWLTSQGNLTFGNAAASPASYMRTSTGAVMSAQANIATSAGLALVSHRAVRLTVEGFTTGTPTQSAINVGLAITTAASDNGVRLVQLAADSSLFFEKVSAGVVTRVPINYAIMGASGQGNAVRNLSLMVYRNRGLIVAFADDQPIGITKTDGMGLGTVLPKAYCSSADGTNQYIQMNRFRLDVWPN